MFFGPSTSRTAKARQRSYRIPGSRADSPHWGGPPGQMAHPTLIRADRAQTVADKAIQAVKARLTGLPGQQATACIAAGPAASLLDLVYERVSRCDKGIRASFAARPKTAIIESLPGVGLILGAHSSSTSAPRPPTPIIFIHKGSDDSGNPIAGQPSVTVEFFDWIQVVGRRSRDLVLAAALNDLAHEGRGHSHSLRQGQLDRLQLIAVIQRDIHLNLIDS